MENRIYLGIKGNVLCLEKTTGTELWRRNLKTGSITNVMRHGEHIIAHVGGHLFCLEAENGRLLWENSLAGLGYGYCVLATEDSSQSQLAAIAAAAKQAGAAAATS